MIGLLGAVMMIFAYVYYFTWFVCPFAFVFGLAYGIKDLIQNNKVYSKGLLIASIALLLILAGIVYPIHNIS